MQETVVDGVSLWSVWQPDRGLNFNSWLVAEPNGAFIVDPLEPDASAVIERCRAAGVQTIVITNRDHQRAAARFAHELGAQIVAPAADAAMLTIGVDRTVADGDDIFGWRVIGLDGYKTPGEMVLFSERRRAAISGDAFWGAPAGALRLMPDDKLGDPVRALLSARRVRALAIDHLLVGDGMPVFGNAAAVLGAMIDARATDAAVHIVNLAELAWHSTKAPEQRPRLRLPERAGNPAPFGGECAEIGALLGAQKLGIAAARLEPNESYCPQHWHTREEELFVVWSGTPTLQTPAGRWPLAPGDCIVFATGEHGAHRLSNESNAACVVLMIANTDIGDVCFYPDSEKLSVEATGTLVRTGPQLDYFDRE